MANWDEIYSGIKKAASKAVSKTGDLADTASLHVKLTQKEANLADLYEQFGRVAYQKIKTSSDVDEKIKVLVEKIDIVRAEIYSINAEITKKKEAREAQQAAAKEAEKDIKKAEDAQQ